MIGKVFLFSEIKERCNGSITLGDKGKCKILGVGKVSKNPSKTIDNVYLGVGKCKILLLPPLDMIMFIL